MTQKHKAEPSPSPSETPAEEQATLEGEAEWLWKLYRSRNLSVPGEHKNSDPNGKHSD